MAETIEQWKGQWWWRKGRVLASGSGCPRFDYRWQSFTASTFFLLATLSLDVGLFSISVSNFPQQHMKFFLTFYLPFSDPVNHLYQVYNEAPSDVNTTLDGSTYPRWKMFRFSYFYFFHANEIGTGHIRDQCCHLQGDGASLKDSHLLLSFQTSSSCVQRKNKLEIFDQSGWNEKSLIFLQEQKFFFEGAKFFNFFSIRNFFLLPLCSIQPSTSTSIGAFQGKEAKDGEKKNENSDNLDSLGPPNYLPVVCWPRGCGVMDRVSACGACSTGLLRRSNVLFVLSRG